MCLGSSEAPKAVAAEAPPAPEPTPEEVIAPEETTAKAQEKKQTKVKRRDWTLIGRTTAHRG